MHNIPNKSSSEYIENKQFKIIQTNVAKEFEPIQRFSIALPNETLAYGIKRDFSKIGYDRAYEKEWEEFYRYHGKIVPLNQQWNSCYSVDNSYSVDKCYSGDNQDVSAYKYQQILLSPIIVFIKKITVDFIAGKYEKLSKILIMEKVTKIMKDLKKLYSKYSNKVMQQMIKTYSENFNIIVDFLNLNKTFESTKRHLEELEKVTSILKDKQALLEYLKTMNPQELLSVSIDAPYLEIKPEYEEYHRRYGIPEYLNYDLAKLNHIKHYFESNPKA
jgi:hypothetical protein